MMSIAIYRIHNVYLLVDCGKLLTVFLMSAKGNLVRVQIRTYP